MEKKDVTVLIVDDEENIRTVLKRSLEKDGYTVIEAENGETGLEKTRKNEVHVVILDIKMPGMSGIDVLKELAVYRPDTMVIMATAVNDVQTAVDSMRLGAYNYITKPFDLDNVIVLVEKALQKRQLTINERRRLSDIQDKLSEQSQQLATQFRELMSALMREQRLLAGSDMSKLPPELQKPMSSVDDFKDALLRILKRQQID